MIVRVARGFVRFWYEFIVGDDWKIAAAVAAVLAAGAALVAMELVRVDVLAPVIGAAIVAAFAAGLLIDVRRRG